MKKAFIVLCLCFSLGGCLTLQELETGITLGTASVANPVTEARLNQIESTAVLVFTGLKAWRTSCVQGLIPDTCKQQIRTVQIFTRQIPPYLTELRGFVRDNDQVNAGVVFNVITDLIGKAKATAAFAGQKVGS